MPEAVEGLPGLLFDFSPAGHVVFAYCERCGHRFDPRFPMGAKSIWRIFQDTNHASGDCDTPWFATPPPKK